MKNFQKYFWPLLFLLHFVLRLPALWTPFLDIDESQFAGFAHVLMQGGKPYLDSLDTKPLGIYYFYYFGFWLFGKFAMWGIHLLTMGWTFLIPVFLYATFAALQKKNEGKWAALFFVIFSTCYLPKFLSTSITQVMMPFLVMAYYFSIKGFLEQAIEPLQSMRLLTWDAVAGLLVGVAFLFKYQAGIQTVHFFFLTLLALTQNKSVGRFVWRNFWFAVWFLVPFALHTLHLKQIGVWGDFLLWSVEGSRKYIADGQASSSFLKYFVLRFGSFVLATVALWVLVVRTGFAAMLDQSDKLLKIFGLSWLALSFIPVCVGGRFYSHYFLQIMPAACALAALANLGLPIMLRRTILICSLVPLVAFFGLRFDHRWYLQRFPDDALYEQQTIGEALRAQVQSDDTIFVWGFATLIYFYAEAKPATRFLWTDWQTGRAVDPTFQTSATSLSAEIKYAVAWEKLWEDFTQNPPRFFVDTSVANIHDYQRYPVSQYPRLHEYVTEHYQKVSTVLGVDIFERLKQ